MKYSYIYYKDKLNNEYRNVFDQIEMYVMVLNIDESTREDRLGDLLDIFISAQNNGKPVQKITGNNLERFCHTFCADFGARNRIFNILDWFKTIAWVLAVISSFDVIGIILDAINTGNIDIWRSNAGFNISMYIVAILISGSLFITTNIAIRNIMFKTKRISMGLLKTVCCIEAVVSFVIIYMLLNQNNVRLFNCPVWAEFAFPCAYLLMYYPLSRKRIKRQKVKFADMISEDIQKETAKNMEKRFEKAKRKSRKKGKGELSLSAFLDKEERSCDLSEKMKLFYIVFPVIITVISYIFTYLNEGFETYADSILYIGIMLVVEYLIVSSIWKINRNILTAIRAWIKEKRDEADLPQ